MPAAATRTWARTLSVALLGAAVSAAGCGEPEAARKPVQPARTEREPRPAADRPAAADPAAVPATGSHLPTDPGVQQAFRVVVEDADGEPVERVYLAYPRRQTADDAPLQDFVGAWHKAAGGVVRWAVPTWRALDLSLASARSAPVRVQRPISSPASEETVDLGTVRLAEGEFLGGDVYVGGLDTDLSSAWLHIRRKGAPVSATATADQPLLLGTLEGSVVTLAAWTSSGARGRWSVDGLTPGEYDVEVVRLWGAPLHEALRARAHRTVSTMDRRVGFLLSAVHLRAGLTDAHLEAQLPRVEVVDADGRSSDMALRRERWPGDNSLPPATFELAVAAESDLTVRWWYGGTLRHEDAVRTPKGGGSLSLGR